MKTLRTIGEIVDVLGGPTEVARELDLEGPAAVCNWPLRGYIPRGWHLVLYLKLKALGYDVDLSVFGMDLDRITPKPDPVLSLPG